MARGGASHEGKAQNLPPAVFDQAILNYVAGHCDFQAEEPQFAELALEVFAFQYANNGRYRAFCDQQGMTPRQAITWKEVPALPVSAFKYLDVACFPVQQALRTFLSSGTTQAQPSRHAFDDLTLYDTACQPNFARHVLPDDARLPFLLFAPTPSEAPHSSLVHMLEVLAGHFARSAEYVISHGRITADRVMKRLKAAERGGEPIALLGTSFAFVQLLDACREGDVAVRLPPGSRLMDTGGFKGKTREVPRETLYQWIAERLGIPRSACVNEYGMTELSSQFYDVTLRLGPLDPHLSCYKVVPPWVRVVVVNPVTLQEVQSGDVGLLRIYDLVNRGSVMAIQTEDLGRMVGDGFEVVGRAPQAEQRGCSLTMEDFAGAGHRR